MIQYRPTWHSTAITSIGQPSHGMNGRSSSTTSAMHASSSPVCSATIHGKCRCPYSTPPFANAAAALRFETTSSKIRSPPVSSTKTTYSVTLMLMNGPASCAATRAARTRR